MAEMEVDRLLAIVAKPQNTDHVKGAACHEIFCMMWSNMVLSLENQNLVYERGGIEIIAALSTDGHSDFARNRAFNTLGTMAFDNNRNSLELINNATLSQSISIALTSPQTAPYVRERAAYVVNNMAMCQNPKPPMLVNFYLPLMIKTLFSEFSDSATGACVVRFLHKISDDSSTHSRLVEYRVTEPLSRMISLQTDREKYLPSFACLILAKIYAETLQTPLRTATSPDSVLHSESLMRLTIPGVVLLMRCACYGTALPGTVHYPTIGITTKGILELAKYPVGKAVLMEHGYLLECVKYVLESTTHPTKVKREILSILWLLTAD
eukprot:c5089_g1_i3.p1 GENE.c5089_g1_i3~~c5089_g1_i3.p1  ORF type:complete len:337 (-),score=72.21 c5089_g1_i3:147-1118(-)